VVWGTSIGFIPCRMRDHNHHLFTTAALEESERLLALIADHDMEDGTAEEHTYAGISGYKELDTP